MHGNPASSESASAIQRKIEAIPEAMYRMGWTVSAQLMERWLRSPAWVLPESWKGKDAPDPRYMSLSQVDQDIVRMSWALASPRVNFAMNALREKMANDSAKKILRGRLTDMNFGPDGRIDFGSLGHRAIVLDASCQSNWHSFGDSLDTLDDLYGGLGKATLKVGLIGEATRHAKTDRITLKVAHAGFYIRDTYDFNGFQYLGTWTKNGVLSKTQMLMNSALDGMVIRSRGEPIGNVYNHDFESYRRLTGYGGDFVIYSDVLWEPANFLIDLA